MGESFFQHRTLEIEEKPICTFFLQKRRRVVQNEKWTKTLSSLSNKVKPRQLRRQRRLVLAQRARRHPGVRRGVVAPRRSAEQRAAAARALDRALTPSFVLLLLLFQQILLLGARGKLRERELALEPPRRSQVAPADCGLPGDPRVPPAALRVDAGEGDVEDLERDEGVVVVRGRSGGGGGAVAAVAVAGAAAASASPGEVLRAQNELDRLFCLFVCFVLIRSSWSWKGMKKSVRCLFVLFFSSESVCQPCLSKRGTTQPRQRRRRQN